MSSTTRDDDMPSPGKLSRTARLVAPVQRSARDDNGVATDAETAVTTAATSSSAPLPAPIQRKFETSLGADLSSVRVHTGSDSAAAASAVGARAYTTGQDVHFAEGQYDPSSARGEHLLAHEVAHTVQQRSRLQLRQHKLEVSTPADAAEHEADAAADAMVTGQSAAISGFAPNVALMRDRVAPVTLAGSVPQQILVMRRGFDALMAEADDIIAGVKFHFDYVTSIYEGCEAIQQVVVGQAAEEAERKELAGHLFMEAAMALTGFAAEKEVLGALARLAKAVDKVDKVAGTVKKVGGIAAAMTGIKAPKADAEAATALADPRFLLERVISLTQSVSTYRNDGNAVFNDASETALQIGMDAPASGAVSAATTTQLLELRSACDASLADAKTIVEALRVLRDRRKVEVPSWQQCEQDIWIAWFAARGSMGAAANPSNIISRHGVVIGLWGPDKTRGGITGLPAEFDGAPTPTVEIPAHEDADARKSVPAQHLDMFGMIQRLAGKLPKKWARILLLAD